MWSPSCVKGWHWGDRCSLLREPQWICFRECKINFDSVVCQGCWNAVIWKKWKIAVWQWIFFGTENMTVQEILHHPPPLSEIFLKILVVAFRHIPEALDDFMPHMIAYNAGKWRLIIENLVETWRQPTACSAERVSYSWISILL